MFYDENTWEAVGTIAFNDNMTISLLRKFGIGLREIIGGKSVLLQTKLNELRDRVYQTAGTFIKERSEKDGNEYRIGNFSLQEINDERMFMVNATGTLLRRLNNSNMNRRNRRNTTRKNAINSRPPLIGNLGNS